jgi:hypothetical protein
MEKGRRKPPLKFRFSGLFDYRIVGAGALDGPVILEQNHIAARQ